jgi:uncharacterized protein DUF1488
MPLQRGEILGYDFNRMVVDFTMLNQSKTVRCAISTAAMDDLEGKHDVKADQRVDQFVRLRDAIEERASRKFFEGPRETEGPVVLRSNDFFKARTKRQPAGRPKKGSPPSATAGEIIARAARATGSRRC